MAAALPTIERKKTDKIDLLKPIQKYIRSTYDEKTLADHAQALTQLQQMREEVRNLQDKNDASKDILMR